VYVRNPFFYVKKTSFKPLGLCHTALITNSPWAYVTHLYFSDYFMQYWVEQQTGGLALGRYFYNECFGTTMSGYLFQNL
jgi:hypothetical protein